MNLRPTYLLICAAIALPIRVFPQTADADKDPQIASFELTWRTLRDGYWDPHMSGLNWQAIHDRYLEKIRHAKGPREVDDLLDSMVHELPSSHLAVIPASLYRDEDRVPGDGDSIASVPKPGMDEEGASGITVTSIGKQLVVERVESGSNAEKAGVHTGWIVQSVDDLSVADLFQRWHAAKAEDPTLIEEIVDSRLRGAVGRTVHVAFLAGAAGEKQDLRIPLGAPAGKLVEFSNLPPEHVVIEHRKLDNGAGYVRLNVFLNPVLVMPELAAAIEDFRDSPGIVLDLRGNPGGLGLMAMGFAGWFVSKPGMELGLMTSRTESTEFEINPRMQAYTGRLAILMDHRSASTSEILAQGLQDIGRARIFGTRSAGAALPSNIIELPNGDRLQYPEANYTSFKGRVLEGNGVQPDVVVAPTVAALLEGRDLPLEAASAWASAREGK